MIPGSVPPADAATPAFPKGGGRGRAARGSILLDALIGTVILVVALLTHVATTLGASRLSGYEASRTIVVQSVAQFVERVQADPSWSDLYARIRAVQEGGPGANSVELEDGSWAHPPQVYVPDFALSPPADRAWVRLQVPADALDADPSGPLFLREDVTAAAFGLPADLNLDGTVDGNARDADYLVLPVRLTWRWEVAGHAPEEFRHVFWLRGER